MTKRLFSAACFGMVTILIIVLVFALIMASLLRFTSISESSVSMVPMIISIVGLFTGGIIAGLKLREKGLLVGAGTGVLYTVLIFLIQYLGYDTGLSSDQSLLFLLNICTTAIGGTVGVNLFSRKF